MPEILTAKIVYLYASFEYEADTWEILKALWKRQIMVALPRTEGNELFFCLVDKPEELIPGSFGIWEPKKIASQPKVLILNVLLFCLDWPFPDRESGLDMVAAIMTVF